MKNLNKILLETFVAHRPVRALLLSTEILGVTRIVYRVPEESPLFRRGDGEILELPLDKTMARWVLEHGSWQIEDINFVAAHAPKQPLVLLDVGAHIGLMTRQLMHLLPDIAAAVCYEPQALNFAILSRNLAHLPNCHLVQAAVGSMSGRLTFYEDTQNTGNYSLSIESVRSREYQVSEVECVRAHDGEFLNRLPSETAHLPIIWKSDTQGFDEIIATSLSDDFWSRVPVALMEISRINRATLDVTRLSSILGLFPIRRFSTRPELLSVEEILRYAHGSDGSHQDLLLAKG